MTDTTKLDGLRHALLALHKTLLDAQRVRYEREHGRVESRGELLDLVLRDASFEWLRVLSALIAGWTSSPRRTWRRARSFAG